MKNLVITIGVIVVVGIGALVYLKTRPSHLEIAQSAQSRAAYSEALALYIEAVFESSPKRELPDKNKAKVASENEWRNKIADYIAWVSSSPEDVPDNYYAAVQGIAQCTSLVPSQNFMVEQKKKSAVLEGFKIWWKKAFFPEMVTMPENHIPLIEKTLNENMSFVNISSSRNYTYSGCLLDYNSAKRTDFHLYADNNIQLLAKPGDYLLLCKSSARFPSGQVWESRYSVLPVTIPDTSSVVSFTLQTRVSREK
ncbi:MAG: hypothetical protein GF401_05855 [Chitinivibrionales bacterium]|nr:hypothetical protein [Chitinivibrionales bacterium]